MIGKAFYQCAGLIAVEIPNSVTAFNTIFYECDSLRYVVVPSHMLRAGPGSNLLCEGCYLSPRVVLSTCETRLRVLRDQFWSIATHMCLSPAEQDIVFTVMLAGERVNISSNSGSVKVPSEMWVVILQHLRPGEFRKMATFTKTKNFWPSAYI
eukprot:m.50378 g.50378  ORF g.50378 m.50378 type:complete len:153 (-) comp21283_c0_seq1:107-565(-)